MPASEIIIRQATFDDIQQLRADVLRPKNTRMKLHFPGDDAQPPATWHFGGFTSPPEKNIACLTLLATQWDGKPAIQLRGMAVAESHRSAGVGKKLLRAAEAALREHPVASQWVWWCNARTHAIGFYEKLGWKVVSEEFMIEPVGPHKKMIRL